MIERVDFLVALIAIVVTLVGSQTALWLAIQQKADKTDLNRLEGKFDSFNATFHATLERKADKEDLARIEAKLDTLLLRLLPETRRSS